MLNISTQHHCFGGTIGFYAHAATETGTEMKFSAFVPIQAKEMRVPVLYFLAGLTCNEETFMTKANALHLAAKYGLMLVAPDTSPRGLSLPGESGGWDFGVGAGYYLDATEEPWRRHYRMYSYVVTELPAIVEANFPARLDRRGIFGHSMGGHGALIVALKNPHRYHSVSAFAPISNLASVPWGEKALRNYIGPDRSLWPEWDASMCMSACPYPGTILVDQGLDDGFLDAQLRPDALERAAATSGQALTLRRHRGYDHSYWFIQSFIADHMKWHADLLATS